MQPLMVRQVIRREATMYEVMEAVEVKLQTSATTSRWARGVVTRKTDDRREVLVEGQLRKVDICVLREVEKGGE